MIQGHSDGGRDPLEIEEPLSAGPRRTVTPADHQAFRESLAPRRPADPVDELVGELRGV